MKRQNYHRKRQIFPFSEQPFGFKFGMGFERDLVERFANNLQKPSKEARNIAACKLAN